MATEMAVLKTVLCTEKLSDCQPVVLKLSEDELYKIQSSNVSNISGINFDGLSPIWSFAFFTVLFFYCVGIGTGSILGFIKNAAK